MNLRDYFKILTNELDRTLSGISTRDADVLADAVIEAKKVFLCGAGRSGLMARAFAMRLMHMGASSYVIGETATPSSGKGDLLIVCSGSGETGSLISIAKKAKKIGIKVALITSFQESALGELADLTVLIPAPSPKLAAESGFISIQPMGSLFEQGLLLFLDSVVMLLMDKQSMDSNAMFKNHANLE